LNRLANSPEVLPPTTPVKDFAAEPGSTAVADGQAENEQPGRTSRKVRSAQALSAVSAASSEETAATALPAGEEPIAALVEDLSESDVAARPETDQQQAYAAQPISYWQIPQSLRESMPEMRITVLVYAENPQDRFLLINGKRLREKDEVSDGVVVEEIQRDRAIFTFRDYRFQVKS
jgi:general secretion pathway protein B